MCICNLVPQNNCREGCIAYEACIRREFSVCISIKFNLTTNMHFVSILCAFWNLSRNISNSLPNFSFNSCRASEKVCILYSDNSLKYCVRINFDAAVGTFFLGEDWCYDFVHIPCTLKPRKRNFTNFMGIFLTLISRTNRFKLNVIRFCLV
jgi:hypothetical protein